MINFWAGTMLYLRMRVQAAALLLIVARSRIWLRHISYHMCIMSVYLFFLILSTVGESLQPSWRFTDYPNHGHNLLSYKNKVTFESLVLTENKTWTSPTCTITALSVVTYQLQCSQPGFHWIQLQDTQSDGAVNNESVGVIPLDNTAHCYKWKAASINLNENGKVLFKVWAGEMADGEPSKDLYTTTLFQSIGQVPSVTILRPAQAAVSELGYNSSCSCWEFHITPNFIPVYEIMLRIGGRSILAMDCSIRPSLSLITFEWFSGSAIEVFPCPNMSSNGFPVLFQDKQTLGTAVVLLGGVNLITQDGFETYSKFQIRDISDPIDKVDFTKAALCALVNGDVIIVSAGSPSVTASGIPSGGVEHITTRGTAFLPGINLINIVVTWSNIEDNIIYVSEDGGLQFHGTRVPFGSVQSVAVHPNNDEVMVLINLNNNMSQILTYDLSADQWMTDSFAFTTSGGNLTIKFFPGGFGDLVVWEETAVYYSPNKGLKFDLVPVYTVSEGLLTPVSWEVDHNIIIDQVSLGWNGRFAILSAEHQLFYGDVIVGYVLEIPSGIAPYSHPIVMFNSLGELLVISFNESISEVYKVPTYSLLLSALYPPPACLFTRWSHNVQRSLYFLDSSENLTLWISITPRQWQSNQLAYALSNQRTVDLFVREEVSQTAVEGVVERNMSVLLWPSFNVMDQYELTALKLSLVNQNFVCHSPAQTVALISIQCPPTRHIRVRRPSIDSCPEYGDYTYKIPKNAYDPELKGRVHVNGDVDKFIHYNQSLLGCPIRMAYTDVFKPTLELYDGDELVREVDADYVVWEVHGRTDFQYTATANQAGCRSATQTWTEILQDGDHPSIAWTPQTYRHCFQDGGATLNANAPYQILNSSGVSSLSWYGHNAIFVFKATVIAQNYSYCNLMATFAVEVYGATANSYIGYIFLVLTCAVGVAILISSFFYYRYMIKSVKHDKSD